MNYKFIAILCFIFVSSSFLQSKELPIIPKPLEINVDGGTVSLDKNLNIYIDPKAGLNKQYISSIFYELGIRSSFTSKGQAQLVFVLNKKASANPEGYQLKVKDGKQNKIVAEAPVKNGLIYALQSLRQIITNNNGIFKVPTCIIKDEPAFAWRAFMLDESRHFHGSRVVKEFLDEMARLKLNTFHWHLVDDPGWRIEIKKYPELTSIGSKRDFSHKQVAEEWDKLYPDRKMSYTQDDIKEIIQYAADRAIRIVPEIEVPGHASAAIYAYPWLGASSKKEGHGVWGDLYNVTDPKMEEFLHDVLDEVIALFPSRIIHIGGDEANYTHWQNNPQIVEFMKQNNIPTFSDLQVWSINRFSKYLASKDVKMMGWNEITGDNIRGEAHMEASQSETLAPSTIVHFWDGDISLVNKAIDKRYDVVNSNRHFTYLDYGYDNISFQKAYSFNPIPDGLKKKDESKILGLGCQMWGEYTPNTDRLYFQTYPRIAAYAESGWTPNGKKDFSGFKDRFTNLRNIWKEKGFFKGQPEE